MTHRTVLTTSLAVAALALASAPITARVPEPVSPGGVGSVVRVTTACPTFSWGPEEGADRHEILVYHVPESTTAEPGAVQTAFSPEADLVYRIEVPGSASSWTPSTDLCLEPGETYAWTLRSYGAESSTDWAEARLFTVDEAEIEMSDLERAIEKVLSRYLEEGRIDQETAQGILADPSQLLGDVAPTESPAISNLTGPVILDPSKTGMYTEVADGTSRLVGIFSTSNGTDGSAGIRGESKANPFSPGDPTSMEINAQTYGVIGRTYGLLGESAGVLGESASTNSSYAKYGVLGISSDSNEGSAGVAGVGNTGLLGIGAEPPPNTPSTGIGVIAISEPALITGLSSLPAQTGVFGLGKSIGVRGVGDTTQTSSKGVIGIGGQYGVEGTGLGTSGRGGYFTGTAADVTLGTGVVTLDSGLSSIRFLLDDGTTPADIEGVFDASTFGGVGPEGYLRRDVAQEFIGSSLKINGNFDLSASPLITLPAGRVAFSGGGSGSNLNADLLDGGTRTDFLEYGGITADIDMQGVHLVTNIGNTGTDFTSGGGLTLAGDFSVALGAQFGSFLQLQGLEQIRNDVNHQIHFLDTEANNRLQIDLCQDPPTCSLIEIRADRDQPAPRSPMPLRVRAEDNPGIGAGADLILVAGDAGGTVGPQNGGSVVLDPGIQIQTGIPGSVKITSTKLLLDSDNTQDGGTAEIVAPDPDIDGRLIYDRQLDIWKLDNGDGNGETAIATLSGASGVLTNPVLVPLELKEGEAITNETNHVFRIQDDELGSDLDIKKNFKTLDIEFEGDSFLAGDGVAVYPNNRLTTDATASTVPQDGFDLILRGGDPYVPAGTDQNGGDLVLQPGSKANSGQDGVIRVEGKLQVVTGGGFDGEGTIELGDTRLVAGNLDFGTGTNDDLSSTDVSTLTGGTGSDASSLHVHDGRYFTETELSATGASAGADLIGIDSFSGAFSSPLTVQNALEQLAGGAAITKTLQQAYEDGSTINVAPAADDPGNGPLAITDSETSAFTTMSLTKTADIANNQAAILFDVQASGDHGNNASVTGLDLDISDTSPATSTRTGINIAMQEAGDNAILTTATITAAQFSGGGGSLTGITDLATSAVNAINEIASGIKSGSTGATHLVTGTGTETTDQLLAWDANGNAVNSGILKSAVVTGAVSNLATGAVDAITEVASGIKSGSTGATHLVTGTGTETTDQLLAWDANGNAVNSGILKSAVVTSVTAHPIVFTAVFHGDAATTATKMFEYDPANAGDITMTKLACFAQSAAVGDAMTIEITDDAFTSTDSCTIAAGTSTCAITSFTNVSTISAAATFELQVTGGASITAGGDVTCTIEGTVPI